MAYTNFSQADWFYGTQPSAAAQALGPTASAASTQPADAPAIPPEMMPGATPSAVSITEIFTSGSDTQLIPGPLPLTFKQARYIAYGLGAFLGLLLLKKMLRRKPQVIIQQVPAARKRKKN